MLFSVAEDVKKHYYDPKLHGVDWENKISEARKKIETAESMDGAVSEIAAVLDSLNDSHTFFVPPPRNQSHDYGFKMKMIGDRCYVVRVQPGSDAEKKGLRPGDLIAAINEHPVTRKTFWRIQYIYNFLRPQPGLRITVGAATGQQHPLEIAAKSRPSDVAKFWLHQGINQWVRDVQDERQFERPRYFEQGNQLLVVKFPEFAFSASEADDIIARMRTHKAVILDLRDNPGGFSDTLDRLLGGLFENDQKVFERVMRNSTKPVSVTGRHHEAYVGRLVVLINSGSASASELFARVVQLEKRAFVMGDRSAGMVMEARRYQHELYLDAGVFYGASVTDADLLMADSKSLEHVGVEPDIEVLPTPSDLANGRDPVLSKAAVLLGVKLTPEEAGRILPDKERPVH